MPIATQGDVEALLLRALTAAETPYIASLLAKADAEIAAILPGWRFTSVLLNQPFTVRGSGTSEIWLPGRPILAVDSVTVDGELLDPSEYDWAPLGDLNLTNPSRVFARSSTITGIYDFGLAAPPADVVNVAADMVRWAITNPAGIRQETIGQYSSSYGEVTSGVRPSDEHRAALRLGRRYPVPI